MQLTTIKKIQLGAITFLLVLVIAINVTCGILFELITNFLCGSGIDVTGEQAQQALELSDEMCRDMAEEGIVLMKNQDDLLPMPKSELSQVNVFGWRSINNGWIGGASGSVNANNKTTKEKVKTILMAMEENNMEYNTELIDIYESYCNVGDGKALEDKEKFFKLKEPEGSVYTASVIENAKDFSETAIVVIGRQGGEGQDLPKYQWDYVTDEKDTTRTYLEVSAKEEAMLSVVTTNFENVIVIVNSCNGFNYNFLEKYENIDACLWMSGSGQSGTYSLLRTLRGKVTPSAKFTTTQMYDYKKDPTWYNNPVDSSGHITYAEGIYVGYKWFETADAEGYWNDSSFTYDVLKQDGTKGSVTKTGYDSVVQFPFGYGLSYTEFEWEVEDAPTTTVTFDGQTEISLEVTVTNVGERKGKEIVQLYAQVPYTKGGIEKSSIQLVAYAKTDLLLAGDDETVTLKFHPYDMASYDAYDKNGNGFKGYELEKGNYTLSLRTDVHTLKDCDNAEMVYNLPEDVRYAKDPVTGNDVVNRFTGDTAYANAPVDGSKSDTGANFVYMTRDNFAGTFPTARAPKFTGGTTSSAASYTYNGITKDTMPTYEQDNGLYLYRNTDGTKADRNALLTGEGIEINKELAMELGGDYDNPKWEQLLNQMSIGEMQDLINLGGYRTKEVVSIGKKYFLDNDGGSGLNRHIQEGDSNTSFDSTKRGSWTLFPSINLLGASWNDRLAYNYGLALSNEGIATGVDGWYSPSCNMLRTAFDGRCAEYVSEDPLLSGYITAYQVKGAMANGMYTYVKHFAVNETETGRSGLYTWLTEQTMREIYLKPFEYVVKVGGTPGIMSAFNRIGATWAGGNRALLTDVLRTEWGFEGCVITDWSGGGGYMNPTRAIYGGGDLQLSGAGTIAQGVSIGSNATTAYHARVACKNIIYPKLRAYYVSQTHDSSNDFVSADAGAIVVRQQPFAWWVIILVVIDVLAAGGLLVWTLAIFNVIKFKKGQEV